MGRQQVRLAVQSAITAADIDYVGTVYAARPEVLEETAYTQTLSGIAIEESENGSACVLVVNIPSDNRSRYGLVGRSSLADWNKHIVALELFFASMSGEGVPAQLDYDDVVDALMQFIRENPTMSAPATVWSAGEYTFGVKHTQSEAYQSGDGTGILINGVIRFEAWEQVVSGTVS